MTKLETIMKIIEEREDANITTKGLKEYGLNQYTIKKAMDIGKLVRMKKGEYYIVRIQRRKIFSYFKKFTDNVFHCQYEEAYKDLVAVINLQLDHQYDNHMRVYGLLLKRLLKDESYDFSFIDDLWEFSEIDYEESDYTYFIKFRKAVMESKFEDAFQYLSTYRKLEGKQGQVRISTKIFDHLLSNIIYPENNKQKVQRQKSHNSYMDWKKYNLNIKNNQYEEAIQNLKNIMEYSSDTDIPKWIDLLNICIHMEKEQSIIVERDENYDNLDRLQKLYKSLENEDYIMSWRFVLLCIQQNPTSKNLLNYRNILQKIMQINTKNKKQKEEQEKIKKQEKKVEGIQEVTVDNIKDLIYDREYEKVQELLEKYLQNNDNRTYTYVLKLIKRLDQIHHLKMPPEVSKIQYTTSEVDIFKHFFEALKFEDYEEAYEYAFQCEVRNKITRPDDIEFTLYRLILQDIIEAIEIAEKQLEAKKQLQILNEKLNYIIYETNITEQLENLKELLQEKAEWNTSEQVIMYETYALDILDTIEIAKENRLDESYFETYDSQSNQLSTKFLKAIQNGDYVTAYQIITNENWIDQTKTIENKKYFVLYKKLLSLLNNELNRKEKVIFEEKHEESNHIVDVLEEIWQLTKKYQYKEAYVVSQENALEMSDSLRIVLDTYLPLLQTILSKEIHLYLNQYEENMRRGNFDIATKSLMEYQEFVKRLGFNYELDYYFARLESMQKEANSDCFVQKERLYDYGFYCFEQCEYEKCIEIMNQYIELDHDFSAKGYMLRAEAYRVLDSLEASKKDYEKAISIIPEPTAFQKLGMINIQTGDYELALSNFLEYEKRCPNQSLDNLTFISNSYKNLKDTENQKKYELRIQCFNQQEWMKG